MRENRETHEVPSPDGGGGRSGKADGRTTDMRASGESDGPVVPSKRANKAADMLGMNPAAAESVAGRGSAKGNDPRTRLAPDAVPDSKRGMGLRGVRQAAKRDKKLRFTALLHHVNPELLRASYFELNRSATPGTDPCEGRRATGVPTATARNETNDAVRERRDI